MKKKNKQLKNKYKKINKKKEKNGENKGKVNRLGKPFFSGETSIK